MSKYIITDSTSLDKDAGEKLTKDSFYSEKKSNYRTSDSRASNKISTNGNEYYALLSVSDKEINGRSYDKASWKQTVTDGSWVKPYNRPLLRNHDLYHADPSGRIMDAFFVDFESSFKVTSTSGKTLDQEVFDHYKSIGAFNDGTGAVLVKFIADEDTASRIESGLDMTVSQSSYMGKFVCNICDSSYYGYECSHRSGQFYPKNEDKPEEVTRCLPVASDFEPIELSIVNEPANDVSIIYVKQPKASNKNGDSTDGDFDGDKVPVNDFKATLEAKFDDKENIVDNSHVETQQKQGTEVQDNLFKQIAKDHYKKLLADKVVIGEEAKEAFEKFFDSINTEEQATLFGNFINSIEKIEDKEEPVVTEPEVEPIATADCGEEAKGETGEPGTTEEPVKTGDSANTEEPAKEEPVVEPAKDKEATKEENLKTVFDTEEKKIEKFEDSVKDKELLALIKNL